MVMADGLIMGASGKPDDLFPLHKAWEKDFNDVCFRFRCEGNVDGYGKDCRYGHLSRRTDKLYTDSENHRVLIKRE